MGDLIDLVVAEKPAVAHGVTAVTLRHPEGRRLPDWSPGAHVDLVLPNGMIRLVTASPLSRRTIPVCWT
ncbi:hypothetical protein SK571_15455 [Lentzea sp. BCCO 10_0798]|uniref:Uncharacterized protein n=1 Tax=Lentzea kristufekii TaxID=3095430 RepID=A0ABU4TR77_9PSEU|nr:hypothetical protein [Lentzea sp. BCCO 10_0798]MDX8050785.1 hypothetical protein [Lentzea sp. BCCO 10_0798]